MANEIQMTAEEIQQAQAAMKVVGAYETGDGMLHLAEDLVHALGVQVGSKGVYQDVARPQKGDVDTGYSGVFEAVRPSDRQEF